MRVVFVNDLLTVRDDCAAAGGWQPQCELQLDELEQKKRNASYTGVLASFLAAVAGSNAAPVQDSHNNNDY